MKKLFLISAILIIIILLTTILSKDPQTKETMQIQDQEEVKVTPIEHATMLLEWKDNVIYTDPVDASLFQEKPKATIVLVTDIHGDHLNTESLMQLVGDASLIVPQAVKDKLPEELSSKAKVLNNGESIEEKGIKIEAIPMYNIPESDSAPHTKGRGNGYVLEKNGYRVYVAGDTSGIPEMKSLRDIDLAFVPMNLPYTMDIEEASSAVLAFRPKVVYPYHYRGKDGLSDVKKFKQIVESADAEIKVVLANWYPEK